MSTHSSLPLAPPSTPPNNLPVQTTSFVGREREIAEVEGHLATSRLVTLTGAGGCGKTRLALHVAAAALTGYPDGAWLVEFAPFASPARVGQAVASAVGVREVPGRPFTESLVDYLRGRTVLLILDNCEHVVGAAAALADALLRSCPRLRILATSREPLGSAGETAWRLPSLSLPPPSSADEPLLESVARYEAVRLLVERARAARPGFTATDQNAPALAEICRRLDGIPLAIELAAARARVFSVEQIAARLDDRFRLLTTGPRTALPRQQTLRATVDWSYALLSEPERMLVRRLSVFAGGWTFEAAEAVAAGDGIHAYAVLDLLAQLVDKSLVVAEEQRGAVRYRLLLTIREYARERLVEVGEAAPARDRHLAYFVGLAEQAEPKLRGPEDRGAQQQLEAEHDNLRAALEWSLTPGREGDAALRLGGALAWFWWKRSYHDEGRRWLARALESNAEDSAARMKALHGAGWMAHHQHNSAVARELLGESLRIARELGERWTEALVLHHLGRVAYYDDDSATARSLAEQSLALAEEVGDRWLIGWALHLLGLAAHIAADYPTAREYYARSLSIRRELGYGEGVCVLLGLLGAVALREGDLVEAHALHRENLEMTRAVFGPWSLGMPLATFSHLSAALGQPRRAARLGAAAAALSDSYHTPLVPLFEALLKDALDAARRALDEDAYAAAWAEGRAMSPEQAVAEALALEVKAAATPPEPAAEPAAQGALAGLTATERRVLRLLAAGRTTQEIAAELVVAVSTVDRHLTHIYAKLNVRNRVAAAALAIKLGLE